MTTKPVNLTTTHPTLASEWHPTLNGDLLPEHVTAGSDKKVWWKCGLGHEWNIQVYARKIGNGCPYCAGKRVLAGYNDLATTHPELATEWHPTLNGDLLPTQVKSGNNNKAWWAGICGHEWEAEIKSRAHNNRGCSVCAGKTLLKGYNDLASQNSEATLEWHPTLNGNLSPEDCFINSMKNVWWLCDKGHHWEARISSRNKQGSKCPYCMNVLLWSGFNDLATVYPALATEWHPTLNSELTPSQVLSGTTKKVWWQCSLGHPWETNVFARVYGNGCPTCKNDISKAEQEIFEYLTKLGLTAEQSNRIILKPYELDIYIPEKKLAIEFNGLYWHTESKGKHKEYHYNKWKECQNQGIHLIQIWEDNWNDNKEGILKYLKNLTTGESMNASSTSAFKVVGLSESQTQTFFCSNHIKRHIKGLTYFGVVNQTTKEIVAAIAIERISNKEIEIKNYTQTSTDLKMLSRLISHLTKIYETKNFSAIIDNCVDNVLLYQSNGFAIAEEISPTCTYLIKGKRLVNKDSQKTTLMSGMIESQRIWDAGKTRLNLNLS